MSRLVWDDTGNKKFEMGTKKMVLFVGGSGGEYQAGIAWSGITGVTISNTGGDETALWADDIKYGSLRAAEECGGTIEGYQCPREFYPCDGIVQLAPGVYIAQQDRVPFGAAFVTTIGNDTQGTSYGYKIHLIYGATCSPSERPYTTINDSPDAASLSWEFTTTPVNCAGHKPVSHLEIDSTEVSAEKLAAIEDIIFGTDGTGGTGGTDSRLPLPDEIATLLAA